MALLAATLGLLLGGKDDAGGDAPFLRGRERGRGPAASDAPAASIGGPAPGPVSSYGRGRGWDGRTYAEAREFCASRSSRLCSYAEVCPRGLGSRAASASPRMTWVATSDGANSWVNVGPRDSCLRYGYLHDGTSPSWGITGEDSEGITGETLCCPGRDDDPADGTSADVASPAPTTNAAHPATTGSTSGLDPRWRSAAGQGWRGRAESRSTARGTSARLGATGARGAFPARTSPTARGDRIGRPPSPPPQRPCRTLPC